MGNHKAGTVCNTHVAPANDEQTIERDVNSVPLSVGTSTVRPWTSDFLLPSIRYREPSAPQDQAALNEIKAV